MGEFLAFSLIVWVVAYLLSYWGDCQTKNKIIGFDKKKYARRPKEDAEARANDVFYDFYQCGPANPAFYYDGSVRYNYPGGQVFPKGKYWFNCYGEAASVLTAMGKGDMPNVRAPEG